MDDNNKEQRSKIMKRALFVSVFAGLLLMPVFHYAAVVNVFLDDGTKVAGSSNTNQPFSNSARDITWDVLASAESGLSDIGAAVMTVRMVPFNVNGDSRGAITAGGYGLGVDTGSSVNWIDGGTREGALFQLSFYSDAAKTTEITGLDISFQSLVTRAQSGTGKLLDIFVGSGELTFSKSFTGGPINDNSVKLLLGGTELSAANEDAMAFDFAKGYKTGDDTLGLYTLDNDDTTINWNSGVFSEDDSIWVRRRNITTGDDVYQLGAITFNVESSGSAGQLTIVSSSVISSGLIKLVIDAPDALSAYRPVGKTNLASGAWGYLAHSDDGVNPFVETNLSYSTAEGMNTAIYVQTTNVAEFFGIE